MTNMEEQLWGEALIKTCADFGITLDNTTLHKDKSASPPKMKRTPILGDLHKKLLANPRTERIAIIASWFATGSAQLFT